MAMVSGVTTDYLHSLLRRSSGPKFAASEELSVASCLDTHLPIYNFSTRPLESACRLSRKDSFPTVPDFYEDARCDSPDGALPLYTAGADDAGFNALPLGIEAGPQNFLWKDIDMAWPSHDSHAVHSVPASSKDLGGLETSRRQVTSSRPQPRRHASDVLFADRSGCSDASSHAAAAAAVVPSRSLLEAALMTMWEDRADRGLFRYDVSQCSSRVLPGRRGFIAQLNEGRASKKRPTEFSMDRVLQPFDPAKFNFTKASMAEALVAFSPINVAGAAGAGAEPQLLAPTAPLSEAMEAASSGSPNLVMINVSPIDHGHVLLVPRVLERLPQALDCDTVLLALQFARELGSPHFRVGYNSLGAFATINHLHFHSYYLPLGLPCEAAATELLRLSDPGSSGAPSKKRRIDGLSAGGGGVLVSRLVDYPVNGFVVEADSAFWASAGGESAAVAAVAAVVGVAAERLQAANQPFNLLVSDAGRRVFVFPQCYAERQAAGAVAQELLDTGVNPASFEIAGHLVLKRAEDFAAANEGWAARLLAEVSLDEESFMAVARMCFSDGAFSEHAE